MKKDGFECDLCHKKYDKVHIYLFKGKFCDECVKVIQEERRLMLEQEWEPSDIRDARELNDSMLVLAANWLKCMREKYPDVYEVLRAKNPMLLIPEELALEFTERLLNNLPREYIKEERQARGHERLFYGGTFVLSKAIPKDVFVDGLVAAGILKRKIR